MSCILNASFSTEQCAENMFRCSDGTCIDTRRVCDGREDCIDRSDEKECGKI